jgi:hypothetical protein
MEDNKTKPGNKDNKDAIVQPDPATRHTTDPQEHMEGPVSSLVQGVKEEAEKEDGPGTKEKDK